MTKYNWMGKACAIFLLWAATAVALPAQTTNVAPPVQTASVAPPAVTFTTLHGFDYTDGQAPYAGLLQGADGSLYGSTIYGGVSSCSDYGVGCGVIFKLTPGGAVTTLHNFDGADGANPQGTLIQATDGNFYSTTLTGGASNNNAGTVFKITPKGTLTRIHSFCTAEDGCPDGYDPYAGLVQGIDGNFFGITEAGGSGGDFGGTVFKITSRGKLTTLYNFCSQSGCTDGEEPRGGIIQADDGNFYGTTAFGGTVGCGEYGAGCGTIFKITPSGIFATLHSFDAEDGQEPYGQLVQGGDGNFYGTTLGGEGTVFKITPGGELTTLYNFDGADGATPYAGLAQGTDGNFYGTAAYGGHPGCYAGAGCGTIFEITPSGKFMMLYTLCSKGGEDCTDGSVPYAGLIQATDGNFYGTTYTGGKNVCSDGDYPGGGSITCGTMFRLSVGLGPFVETNPGAGGVGAKVGILGTDLTSATSVTFNGTTAEFKVIAKTLIVAEVPNGATTGTVKVKLPGGMLSSNVPFILLR